MEQIADCEPGNIMTKESIDPIYSSPVIDRESHHTSPAAHVQIAGHFENTRIRFNFYFPPKESWDGRFFQLVFPTQSEHATPETIGFALASRAYAVQVTGARGFEAEAAAAELSRVIARRYYDEPLRRIYGYIYGGSGGSFQVIGAMERSRGIWDGAVPFVQAVPISAPNNPSIRATAGLVLRKKAGDIHEALRPGGSGDVLAVLDSVEKDVLIEVTKLGIPLSTFEDFAAATDASTLALLTNPIVNMLDPTYANDFWSKKGYLGTEPSPLGDVFRRARVSFEATVRHVTVDLAGVPIKIHLQTVPPSSATLDEYWYDFTVYSSSNAVLGILTGTFNAITKMATFDLKLVGQNDTSLLKCLSRGTILNIDNSRSLAMRAYYRYQVPERPGFYGFDHLRGPKGSSIYPRRTVDVSARLAEGASDSTHDGDIKGKIIVVQNLADSDAFPWHADWYRGQVKQVLGDQFDNNYRLWFNENSEHDYEGPKDSRRSLVVPYRGMVQQALRDLSDWVEKGVQPPNSTSYNVGKDNSIQISSAAYERGGIQPTVSLTVEGKQKFEARVGQAVNFQASVEVPPGAGKVVFVEWDFFGKGRFTYGHLGVPSSKVHVNTAFAYNTPGTFIVGLRVTSQREGDLRTPYTKIMNLARVSVDVVRPPDIANAFRL
ncbi:hypothetical protein CGCSCA1_v010917 [Colletotrichum siamense]|nr:hypothetical protein CGCSCA1_v010917 [Colletotrichum siamense]